VRPKHQEGVAPDQQRMHLYRVDGRFVARLLERKKLLSCNMLKISNFPFSHFALILRIHFTLILATCCWRFKMGCECGDRDTHALIYCVVFLSCRFLIYMRACVYKCMLIHAYLLYIFLGSKGCASLIPSNIQ
jgi:hypothetical protein